MFLYTMKLYIKTQPSAFANRQHVIYEGISQTNVFFLLEWYPTTSIIVSYILYLRYFSINTR